MTHEAAPKKKRHAKDTLANDDHPASGHYCCRNPLRCKMEIGMLGGIAGVVAGWLSGYAYRSWKYKRSENAAEK